MSVRVGRCKYDRYGTPSHKDIDGFTTVVVTTRSRSEYSDLSPFYLTNERGQIVENVWQFSKLYARVPHSKQTFSRWNKTVIWEYPEEDHVTVLNGQMYPNTNYLRWRELGFNARSAIRYPVGYQHRHKVLCAYANKEDGSIDFQHPLDYINSRKVIYMPIYCQAARKTDLFKKLKERLSMGENLLIIDVDGPHQESLGYYNRGDFIQDDSVLVNKENMDFLLNDPKHPFGHGYCLGMALCDI